MSTEPTTKPATPSAKDVSITIPLVHTGGYQAQRVDMRLTPQRAEALRAIQDGFDREDKCASAPDAVNRILDLVIEGQANGKRRSRKPAAST